MAGLPPYVAAGPALGIRLLSLSSLNASMDSREGQVLEESLRHFVSVNVSTTLTLRSDMHTKPSCRVEKRRARLQHG